MIQRLISLFLTIAFTLSAVAGPEPVGAPPPGAPQPVLHVVVLTNDQVFQAGGVAQALTAQLAAGAGISSQQLKIQIVTPGHVDSALTGQTPPQAAVVALEEDKIKEGIEELQGKLAPGASIVTPMAKGEDPIMTAEEPTTAAPMHPLIQLDIPKAKKNLQRWLRGALFVALSSALILGVNNSVWGVVIFGAGSYVVSKALTKLILNFDFSGATMIVAQSAVGAALWALRVAKPPFRWVSMKVSDWFERFARQQSKSLNLCRSSL